jgi:hypothetical protein
MKYLGRGYDLRIHILFINKKKYVYKFGVKRNMGSCSKGI